MGVFADDITSMFNDLQGIDSTEVVDISIGGTTVDGIVDVEEDVLEGGGGIDRKSQVTFVRIAKGGLGAALMNGAKIVVNSVDYIVHDFYPDGPDNRMTVIEAARKK